MLIQPRRLVAISSVAAPTLDVLPPVAYPGAPLSISYLEQSCHLSSLDRWRGTAEHHHSQEVDRWRKEARSCTDSKDEARIEVQDYMSQRNPASGPYSNAPRRDSQSLPPLSPSLSRPQSSHNAPPESPYPSQPPAAASRTILPPLGSVTSTNRLPSLLTDPPPSRPLSMPNILNPSHDDDQTLLQMQPPSSSGRPLSPVQTAAAPLPPIAKRPTQASPTVEPTRAFSGQTERRILTPKSPGLKASSLGGPRSLGLGPYATSQSPLMRGENRMYTGEPGSNRISELPPFPPPTPLARSSNAYPQMTESAPGQPRRPSTGRSAFATSTAQAQGESPSTSHSSYSHFSQSSPILRYGASTQQHASSFQSGSGRQPVSLPPGQSATNLGEGHYDISRGSYGISIPTEGGQMLLPVEVDVEQASKTANEKRKRNAGASARFRQRRKEKEREASQTISSLERNLRGLEEERNHYRSERDFFRDLYARQLGPAQLPQRPLTPRAQIVSRPSIGDTPPQWRDISREASEPLPRNLRRRTSSYPTTFPAPLVASPLQARQAQLYGFTSQPPAPGHQNVFPPMRSSGAPSFPSQPSPSPHSQNTFPPSRPGGPPSFPPQSPFPPQTAPQPSPQPPPSSHSSSFHDPFRRDVYSRSWNPGP
jgi:hypothetical protein